MICAFPVNGEYACGQCAPCKVNRQRKWLCRLLLEAKHHEHTTLFTTHTYRPEEVPICEDPETGEELQTLKKQHVQEWLKRLRRMLRTTPWSTSSTPPQVRYYVSGEYGTKTERPHYHAILFGLDSRYEEMIKKSWTAGFSCVRPAERINIGYTLKYTLKGLSQEDDPQLRGRQPQFALMSKRPPLGTSFLPKVAESVKRLTIQNGEVLAPMEREIRIDGERFSLDRTMIQYLKRYMDLPQHLEAAMFPKTIFRDRDPAKTQKSKDFHKKAYRDRDKTSAQFPV